MNQPKPPLTPAELKTLDAKYRLQWQNNTGNCRRKFASEDAYLRDCREGARVIRGLIGTVQTTDYHGDPFAPRKAR